MFRGLAIAGMVLVNNPGSWQHVYPPLLHAEWHGFTPTDLVFPAFLFIVGAAIPFTLANHEAEGGGSRTTLYGRIARRVLLLLGLGLLLNVTTPLLQWFLRGQPVDWDTIRIMGVLQRIALALLSPTQETRSGRTALGAALSHARDLLLARNHCET
ncbi:MAG: DUF5009 domain-containing protein, partial [Pseudomonadota bacterium]